MSRTLGNTPKVFPSLDNTAVSGGDIFSRSNDGEGHGIEKNTSIFGSGLIIGIDRRLVNANALSSNHLANLQRIGVNSRDRRSGGVSYSLFERVKVVLG